MILKICLKTNANAWLWRIKPQVIFSFKALSRLYHNIMTGEENENKLKWFHIIFYKCHG